MNTGTKFDQAKPRTDLLSPTAILELAKVLGAGANKYGPHNWRGGIAESRLLGAVLRHTLSYLDGETTDPETGLSHMAHAMANCMFILEQHVTKPELDDRFKGHGATTESHSSKYGPTNSPTDGLMHSGIRSNPDRTLDTGWRETSNFDGNVSGAV